MGPLRVEVRTDQTGWATVPITPTQSLPLGRRNALVMFVRARVEGQSLLAGSSTRRLVQTLIRWRRVGRVALPQARRRGPALSWPAMRLVIVRHAEAAPGKP